MTGSKFQPDSRGHTANHYATLSKTVRGLRDSPEWQQQAWITLNWAQRTKIASGALTEFIYFKGFVFLFPLTIQQGMYILKKTNRLLKQRS